jgi:opacity protein-like surface antigen
MKSLLAATLCVVASTGLANAADNVRLPGPTLLLSGDLSIAGQFTSWRSDDTYYAPESGFGINAYGRALVPIGNDGVAAQFDLGYAQNPSVESLDTEALFGVHLSRRDPARGLLGLMAAVGTGGVDGGESQPGFFLGAEGQIYTGNLTFFLQGGYDWAHEGADPTDEPTRLAVVRGGARFFIDPSTKIDGELSYASGTFNSFSSTIFGWGIGIEKLISGGMVPVSLFARYQGARYNMDICGPATATEQRVMLGASLKFGTNDLLTQDRRGANSDFPRFPSYPALDNLESYGC